MRVVSAIINDIFTDQRVRKQAGVLKSLDCDVVIACRRLPDCPVTTDDSFISKRFSFQVNKGPLFYFLYNLRLLFYLIFHRFDLYIANDLDTLLPCFIVSRIRKKPLVYDAHEYFTEQFGLKKNKLPYNTWKKIERKILPRLENMITVSDSIADLYFTEYGILPVVVRNLAYSSEKIIPASRTQAGISVDDFLVVLQGAGMNPGRGVIELLDAMKITDGVHLLLIGSGDSIEKIKRKTEDLNISNKVTFIPKMPWSEMISYTRMCDAGLSLDRDLSINQRYSLPNKLFDYLSAGIPVIASSLPEVKKIVEQFDCGLLIDNVSPEEISKAIVCLRDNKELMLHLKRGAANGGRLLNWENEKLKEYDYFKDIISGRS